MLDLIDKIIYNNKINEDLYSAVLILSQELSIDHKKKKCNTIN